MLNVSELIGAALREAEAGSAAATGSAHRARKRNVPSAIVFSICLNCNMSCRHCYASAGSKSSPHELTTSEALRILDELTGAGVQSVIFSGGEPLLRADLFPLLEETVTLGVDVSLWTNGVLLTEPMCERLHRIGVSYVGISVDGGREKNDRYRSFQGGFDKAVRAIRLVHASGMRAGLHMTLTRDTVDQLDELYAVARDAGAERFQVAHLAYSGKGRQLIDADLSREESRDVLERLFTLAEQTLADERAPRILTEANESGGPFLVRWLEARHGAAAAGVAQRMLRERGGNVAGEDVLAIDPRGRVHPDPFWQHAVLGDLRKQSFREALTHPLREELQRRAARLQGRCGGCRYVSLCRGSHRERAIAVHGNLWAPDPACVLTDEEIGYSADALAEMESEP